MSRCDTSRTLKQTKLDRKFMAFCGRIGKLPFLLLNLSQVLPESSEAMTTRHAKSQPQRSKTCDTHQGSLLHPRSTKGTIVAKLKGQEAPDVAMPWYCLAPSSAGQGCGWKIAQ